MGTIQQISMKWDIKHSVQLQRFYKENDRWKHSTKIACIQYLVSKLTFLIADKYSLIDSLELD